MPETGKEARVIKGSSHEYTRQKIETILDFLTDGIQYR